MERQQPPISQFLPRALGFTILLLLHACSLSGPVREDKKASGYRVNGLSDDWKEFAMETPADKAYVNRNTHNIFLINSLCERYQATSLESLSKDLLSPIREQKIVEKKEFKIDSRKALLTRVTGSVDGVSVESAAVVLRKNNCLFDFNLSGKKIEDKELQEFLSFVKSFHFESAKGPKPAGEE